VDGIDAVQQSLAVVVSTSSRREQQISPPSETKEAETCAGDHG